MTGPNDGCVYGVTLTMGSYCTKPCTADTDCSGLLPHCKPGGITNPSGSGVSVIKVCNP